MDADTAITEFFERKRDERAESTAKRYRGCVNRWREFLSDERDKEIWEANMGDLRILLRNMKNDEYAPNSIEVARAAVSQFYQKMEDARQEGFHIPEAALNHDGEVENPADGLSLDWSYLKAGTKQSQERRDEKPPHLSPEEVEELVDHAPAPKVRNQLIFRLLYQTGVRRGELASIRLEDIDRDERTILIRGHKTEDNRIVVYQPTLDTLLRIWIESERGGVLTADESQYLFPTKESEQISGRIVTRAVRKAAEKADLQVKLYKDKNGNQKHEVTPHTLRHSYAHRMVTGERGMDIARLQELMGHADIETTRQYLTFKDEDLKEAARTCW